jgi:murein DD-endopeptidase MepM/ murein hydrolase activator NlpD
MVYIYPWAKGTTISQLYGTNPGGVNPAGGHTGMDAVLKVGTPLRAPADGVVVFANWAKLGNNPWLLTEGGGICLVIDAGDTKPTFILAHLSRTDLNIGDRVKQGDIVAYSGNTGTWTTGPHLHFEVLLPGYNIHSNTYGRSNPASVCKGYWGDAGMGLDYASSVTPSAPLANTGEALRKVTSDVAMVRVSPWSWAATAPGYPEGIAKGANLAIVGYVKGEDPYGTGDNAWYKTKSGFYVWANSAGNSVAGLKYLGAMTVPAKPAPKPAPAPAPAPKPAPVPPPTPVTPKYDFVLDFTKINGITVEKIPAHWDNYGTDFPAKPAKAVCHWWNSLANRPSIESVINEFCFVSTSKSPHFIVSEVRIIQVVSLADRAFHAGPGGNDWVGIEIDPYITEKGSDGKPTARALRIQANVRGLLEALKVKYGYKLSLTLHKDVPEAATDCSDINLADLDITPAPAPAPDPTPTPEPAPTPSEEAVLRKFSDWLINMFKNRKV